MNLLTGFLRRIIGKNSKQRSDVSKQFEESPVAEDKSNDVNYTNEESNQILTENFTNMARKTVITKVMEVETNESIIEFPQNRMLLAEQLTDDSPGKAEIVKGLRSMDDVFTHYKPHVKMDFEDMQGQTRKETLSFNELRDFEMDGMIKNSHFLKELGQQKENYKKIEQQLRTNKVLRDAVSDADSRLALINSLQALLKELQDAK